MWNVNRWECSLGERNCSKKEYGPQKVQVLKLTQKVNKNMNCHIQVRWEIQETFSNIKLLPKLNDKLFSKHVIRLLESGGSVDDDEVKEVFDDEAIRRKLRDLCAFLFTVEESKEVPLPEILFMGRRTHWKISQQRVFQENAKCSYKRPRADGACPRGSKGTWGWNVCVGNYAVWLLTSYLEAREIGDGLHGISS